MIARCPLPRPSNLTCTQPHCRLQNLRRGTAPVRSACFLCFRAAPGRKAKSFCLNRSPPRPWRRLCIHSRTRTRVHTRPPIFHIACACPFPHVGCSTRTATPPGHVAHPHGGGHKPRSNARNPCLFAAAAPTRGRARLLCTSSVKPRLSPLSHSADSAPTAQSHKTMQRHGLGPSNVPCRARRWGAAPDLGGQLVWGPAGNGMGEGGVTRSLESDGCEAGEAGRHSLSSADPWPHCARRAGQKGVATQEQLGGGSLVEAGVEAGESKHHHQPRRRYRPACYCDLQGVRRLPRGWGATGSRRQHMNGCWVVSHALA